MEKEDILAVLLTTFQSLAIDSNTLIEKEQIKDEALQESFTKSFQLSERLISGTISLFFEILKFIAYNCSLWEKIPVTGTLFLTENNVCFASTFTKKFVTLPFEDITSITKETIKAIQYIRMTTRARIDVSYILS
jgi:hypothetical protein